jgi:hypothetical protein
VEAQAEAGRAAAAAERACNPAPSEDSAGVAGSERAASAREPPPPGGPDAAPAGAAAVAGAAPELLGDQAAAAGLHESGRSAAGAGSAHAWPAEAAPDLASDSEGDDDSDDLEGYQDVLVRPHARHAVAPFWSLNPHFANSGHVVIPKKQCVRACRAQTCRRTAGCLTVGVAWGVCAL